MNFILILFPMGIALFKGGFAFFKIKSAAQILKFLHIFAYDFGAYFH